MNALANRNFKEITRDPLTLVFAILLPTFLLFIFQQFKIPSELYNINNFTPSIIIFGFSFLTLFTATLISKDRSTSLLSRLYASPLKSYEYIIGYTISVLPVALLQSIIFYITAILLGLPLNINIIINILISVPISILFIALGILVGSLVNDKAAPGIGSVIVQLVVFTSGMYFDVNMMGSVIKTVSNILPFKYCVDISRASLSGNLLNMGNEIIILLIYIIIVFIISFIVFKRKMVSDSK